MPAHYGNSGDYPMKVLDQMVPGEPIIGPPIEEIKGPAPGNMDWQERLRATEEMLRELSKVYPLTWHGNG